MEMKKAALEYLNHGWNVIPVKPNTKQPALRSWKEYSERQVDEKQIAKWWPNDEKGIAVVLGEISGGLICRDFDKIEAYEAWAKEYPEQSAILPTVETARGRHVYCRSDLSELLAQTEGGKVKHFADGELRISDCICLLPPTIHQSGTHYKWLVEPTEVIPEYDPFQVGFLTSWLEEDVTERDGEGHRKTEKTDARGGICIQPIEQIVLPQLSPNDPDIPADVLMILIQTLPKGFGLRHRQVFDLARGLKSIPRLFDVPAKELRPLVRYWHQLALESIQTKPFDETWIDFINAWKRVKFPQGSDPIQGIFNTACASAIPEFALRDYEQEGVIELILLCRELQRTNGENPFYLSVRTAQRLLKLPNPMAAQRWLFLLREDGVIKEVEKGAMKFRKSKSGKKPKLVARKASRYRYLKELD